jgi:hypothetical protein
MNPAANNNNHSRPRAYSQAVQWCFELMEGHSVASKIRILDYRKRAIFVVHGIGSHLCDSTAVFLREGFEDALDNLHKNEVNDPSFENLPATYIKEGYWGYYDKFEQCFPELWESMPEASRSYFSRLWKTRTESVISTAGWFLCQAWLLVINPHKFGGYKVFVPFRCLYFLVIALLASVGLLILLIVPKCHGFIRHYLGDARLYLAPKGPIEHAIVQQIDARVRDDFLQLLGVDLDFDQLPDLLDRGRRTRLKIGKEPHRFKNVTWVAHSLGTVVSYNVISELLWKCRQIRKSSDFDQHKKLKVERVERGLDRFYTLGSPLQMVKVLFPKVLKDWPETDYLKEDFEWMNFYHCFDPISGRLTETNFSCAENCHTKLDTPLPGWAHIRYWHTVPLCKYILAKAQPSIPTDVPLPRGF